MLGFATALLLSVCNLLFAESSKKVLCHKSLAKSRRDQLAKNFQRITGWKDINFDDRGSLSFSGEPVGGSVLARDILIKAVSGPEYFILEDASRRADVVFCRIVPGKWMDGNQNVPVSVILIDFADFDQVIGDESALAAFNVGWAVLHEIVHGVKNLDDPETDGQIGDCEKLINQMRRECGLAERAEYFYKMHPGATESESAAKYVRLPFDQKSPSTNKTKRYWIVWDAAIVGGSH